MKNFTKLVGIIAMVAILALAVSCSKNEGSGENAAGAVADAAGVIASVAATPASDFSYDLINEKWKNYAQTLDWESNAFELSDGVIITGYTGNGGKVVIPATIEDIPVVAIGPEAFQGETNTEYRPAYEITEVVIPEGIDYIAVNSFRGCKKLTTVTLPTSLKFIGHGAFVNCTELVNLTIPDAASFRLAKHPLYSVNVFTNCGKLPLKTRARLVELGHNEF